MTRRIGICAVICLIISASGTNGNVLAIKTQHNQPKLPEIICNLVRDAAKIDRQIDTVSLAIFRNNFDVAVIDGILQCLPKRLSMIVTDFKSENSVSDDVKKPSIVIVITDENDMKVFKDILDKNHLSTVLNHKAKFLVITSDRNSQASQKISTLFPQKGIINFSIFHEINDEVILEVPNPFTNSTAVFNQTTCNGSISILLPDKLKNLNGYNYRIIYHNGMSYAHHVSPFGVAAKNVFFFKAIAKQQNATFSIKILDSNAKNLIYPKLLDLIDKNEMDMTLSQSYLSHLKLPKIQTYDELALCAAIPRKLIREHQVLTFIDLHSTGISRFLLVFIFAGFIIVWKLYQNHGAVNSTGYITFVIAGHCLGHHNRISNRNRRILKIMIQITLLGIMFMKIVYECHKTSKTIERISLLKYDDLEELLQNESTNIGVYSEMAPVIDSLSTESVKGKYTISDMYGKPNQQIVDHLNRLIAISKCDFLDHFIRAEKVPSHFLSSQRYFPTFIQLEATPLSPFTDRIQTFMNWAFDSGLTRKWENIYLTMLFGTEKANLRSLNHHSKNVDETITYDDLKPTFRLIFALYLISIFVFLCEIFWYNFLSRLLWKSMFKSVKNKIQAAISNFFGTVRQKWHFWKRNRNVKVRRIQVQPVNK